MQAAITDTQMWLLALAFSSIRLLTMFSIMPVLSEQVVPGMARRTVVIALALIIAPLSIGPLKAVELNMLLTTMVVIKEVFIGVMIGFLGGVPFWVAENVGNFIDNQRGATMGEIFSPLSGSQASPIGLMMLQVAAALFFVTGAILVYLAAIYESYEIWPIFSVLPTLEPSFPLAFLNEADAMMKTTVVLSAPVVLVMLLATLGLGIINRSAPQLNVFFLSMPVKSALGIFFMIPYMPYLLYFIEEQMKRDILAFIQGVLR